MPYIITTKQFAPEPARYGVAGPGVITRESRRAVATLDELEARLYNEVGGVHGKSYEPLCATIEDLLLRLDSGEESGGTVGPLPDGAVIEVEEVNYVTLRARASIPFDDRSTDAIIDAFNAR